MGRTYQGAFTDFIAFVLFAFAGILIGGVAGLIFLQWQWKGGKDRFKTMWSGFGRW